METNRSQVRWLLALLVTLSATALATAQIKDWNRAADGFWSDNVNWSPNGIPGAASDVYLGRSPFPAGFLTTLDVGDAVGTLTVMGGSRLTTGNQQLAVDRGLTTVTGAGSTIFLGPRNSGDFDSLDAEGVLIENGGRVNLLGGILELERGAIDVTSGAGGTGSLGGYGTIELVETGLGGSAVLDNSGRLFVARDLLRPLNTTLTITNLDTGGGATGTGSVDLDGTTENGIVDVDDGTRLGSGSMTLVIDAALSDAFDGTMQIGQGDTVDMRDPWSLATGTIDFNGASATATLRGGRLTMSQSSSQINVNSGTARIDAPLTANTGTIYVGPSSTLHLHGNSTVAPDVIHLNAPSSALRVTGLTNIQSATEDFEWDGQGGGATTTVAGAGLLTINTDNIDLNEDIFNGRIILEDEGDLSVTVADGRWDLAANATLSKHNVGRSTFSGSAISVQGDVNVTAGELEINAEFDIASAAAVSVASGARMTLNGQHDITQSSLTVDGTLQLNGPTVWRGPASVTGSGKIVNEGSATIAADTTIGVATFDWDQGSTVVEPGRTLTLDVNRIDTSNDTFNNNPIRVNSGNLSVNVADGQWDLGASGVLTLDNTGGGTPTLNGDLLAVRSEGEVRVRGGTATINAPLKLHSGGQLLVQDPVVVNLDGPTTLDGGDIVGAVGAVTVVQDGDLTVTGASSVSVTTYDWDEGDTTVQSNGALDINVTNIDTASGQRYDRTLTVNSGSVDIRTGGNTWTMDGTLRLNNSANKIPVLSGSTVNVGDDFASSGGAIRVDGSGVSRIAAPTRYHSDADVEVASGAALEHTSNVTFLGGGTFGGSGQLLFSGNVQVDGNTTIQMPGGEVDFDTTGDAVGNTIAVNGPLTVNALDLRPFGQSTTSGTHRIVVDNTAGGTLTTNVGNGDWQVVSGGRLDLISDAGNDTVLSGSDLTLLGTMNVTGNAQTSARMDILGGTINVQTAGQPLRLNGGTLTDVNRIVGGTISGAGRLAASTGRALHGFGVIDTDIDFQGSARLKADDGTLTVNGAILGAGVVGTASDDGVLHVTNPWSTSAALLQLAGGSVSGGTITNNGVNGILGHGTISAEVVNSSVIAAEGGTLTLTDPANDYSVGADGELRALDGNLAIQASNFGFGGHMWIGSGREVYLDNSNGSWGFEATSELTISGGNLRSSGNVDFEGGTVTVNGGVASEVRVDSGSNTVYFYPGSNTLLNQDLRVSATGGTQIFSGAVFSGGGTLLNEAGSELSLDDGAHVGVALRNEGLLELNSASARADVADLILTDTSTLTMGLAGTLLDEFDRLVMSGAAQLAGTLDVDVRSSFTPVLGDLFPIVATTGGVFGTFDTELLPSLSGGLELDVVYDNNSVLLEVIQGTFGFDFDGDGIVGGNDVDNLVGAIAAGTHDSAFDLTGDGLVNDDDLGEWLVAAGAINLASGNPYLRGDASLDGVVDVGDFNSWNAHKFTATAAWTAGDFNADGFTDVADFNAWNANKFTASNAPVAVPEPGGVVLSCLLLAFVGTVRRRP